MPRVAQFPRPRLPTFCLQISKQLLFKDLKKQLKLARIYWGAVIATLLIHVGMKYYTQFQVEEGQLIQASAGASFYLTVIAMPFAHLAFMNILKDKRTIASIDRIR